ncbi:MAG TPA: ATP-binding cassette domain-containing protein [Gemmatimonadaceae bacterium]
MTELLCADCVGKSYRGRRILSSASLRAVPGELRALLGRNGAGKSTLLKIAAGWVQPDTGSVRWDAETLDRATLSSLARLGLFYLPDHDLLSDAFTIRRQLEMLMRQYDGLEPEEAARRTGVEAHLDKRPRSLSGGELRRAELAAVLVRRPRCLLADEPYRGIAPKDAEVLTSVFRELAESGVAVVVTGHEVPTLLAAADHVTWCVSGTTYELGAPERASEDERFRREYLGAGFARAVR